MHLTRAFADDVKDVVLVGGGHSHVAVLKSFGMTPMPGVRLTLVTRDVETPYSGMLPGVVAGHYSPDEAHIDLLPLARFADARTIVDDVVGLDLAARAVHFRLRPPIGFDVLSINTGSTPNTTVPGAAEHALPVKPISQFLARWHGASRRLLDGRSSTRVAVVGGGAAGVELVLAVQHSLLRAASAADGPRAAPEFHLFTGARTILPTHSARVRQVFAEVLTTRGVVVHTGQPVVEVTPGCVRTADGSMHVMDEILWTTEAVAPTWLSGSGLAVDAAGFVRVSRTLESISHAGVFAAGDVAALQDPRPKSGVYAVRQGGPLAANLRRAVRGEPLKPYRPQRRALSLISTGDRYAVASRGPLTVQGAWVWRLKDAIDRRFMRAYSDLPAMASSPGSVEAEPRPVSAEAVSATSARAAAMRCGGCGAKVGADVLARAVDVLRGPQGGVVVGLDAPDDAAVIDVGGQRLVQSIDFFRAMVDDPFVFGQVAANHALGDIYAMGGRCHSALAIATIPVGPARHVEETLRHLLAGAAAVLRDAGAVIVGGHSAEGAELAFGLAVTGLLEGDRIMRKRGLEPGDRLILTKPLGTGVLFAAHQRGLAKGRWIATALESMTRSSRASAQCAAAHGARACTDVTGFGLLGHLAEMMGDDVDVVLDLDAVPLLDGALQTVGAGVLSSMYPQNLRAAGHLVQAGAARDEARVSLLFDPQTAGGLLAGVPAATAASCLAALHQSGDTTSAIIGTVLPRKAGPHRVTFGIVQS